MQQLSGINAVIVYGGKIAQSTTTGELALLMPSMINSVKVIAAFFTSWLLTKLGRKTLLVFGSLFEGIACAIVMIGYFIKDDSSIG